VVKLDIYLGCDGKIEPVAFHNCVQSIKAKTKAISSRNKKK